MPRSQETLDEIPVGFLDSAMDSETMSVYVQFGALSHQGNVRQNNEDQYAVIRRRRSREALMTSLPSDSLLESQEEAYILIVADGMGGAAFGEVASELALRTAWEQDPNDANWPPKVNQVEARRLLEDSDAYIQLIHRQLQQRAHDRPELAGMGTTLTAAYSIGMDAFVVHVGDSRAYLIRNGIIRQVTRDHTLAQQLVDAGVEASRTTAFQHVLTNCLGGGANRVTSELHHVKLEDGDHLLLCTDGLSDLVTDEQIRQTVQASQRPQDACNRLVDLALQRGGKDNITVVIARYTQLLAPEDA